MELSVIIVTYQRDKVLADSIGQLIPQLSPERELIIVDQSPAHDLETQNKLSQWHSSGAICWIKLVKPSVTISMNQGLLSARGDVVLFLDDDINPSPYLLDKHVSMHRRLSNILVAGRVVQPWQRVDRPLEPASFNSDRPGTRDSFMGGNFSIGRIAALQIGGFDENFRYAAYQYERDFADRAIAAGISINYSPAALIYHLHSESGGVRAHGHHLTSAKPGHSLGGYYYILRSGNRRLTRIMKRLAGSVVTRFHLRHPWYVPITIVGELRGLMLATVLWLRGPVLLGQYSPRSNEPAI